MFLACIGYLNGICLCIYAHCVSFVLSPYSVAACATHGHGAALLQLLSRLADLSSGMRVVCAVLHAGWVWQCLCCACQQSLRLDGGRGPCWHLRS